MRTSGTLRIATYNVEWFTDLFDGEDRLYLDQKWSRRHNVTRLRQTVAIAEVLQAVDADLWLIVEAPNTGKTRSTARALRRFAREFGLRQNAALIGFESPTDQELALLFDPDIVAARHQPLGLRLTQEDFSRARLADPFDILAPEGERPVHAPRFDGVLPVDLNEDGDIDLHVFSKPPIEAVIDAKGLNFRIIGVHAKSKAAYGARNETHARKIALENRRKQLAQCAWIRLRTEEHLAAGDDLVVLGDFNDGPGLDFYEKRFGRSGVELVMGDPGSPETLLRNPYTRACWSQKDGWRPSSARFYDRERERHMGALLDFIMLSPGFADRVAPEWRIWNPFEDQGLKAFHRLNEKSKRGGANDSLFEALVDASDHFPVSVDITP